MLGPIDYVVIGFRGSKFDGSIINELSQAVDSGVIRIIDLVFIIKDADGNVLEGEYEDQPEELKTNLSAFDNQASLPILSESDLEKIAAAMSNNTAAGVLIIEHLWAIDLKRAIIDAGGILIDEGRIHPEVVAGVMEEIEQER